MVVIVPVAVRMLGVVDPSVMGIESESIGHTDLGSVSKNHSILNITEEWPQELAQYWVADACTRRDSEGTQTHPKRSGCGASDELRRLSCYTQSPGDSIGLFFEFSDEIHDTVEDDQSHVFRTQFQFDWGRAVI